MEVRLQLPISFPVSASDAHIILLRKWHFYTRLCCLCVTTINAAISAALYKWVFLSHSQLPVSSGEYYCVEDASLLKCRKEWIYWYENKFADWLAFLSLQVGGGAAGVTSCVIPRQQGKWTGFPNETSPLEGRNLVDLCSVSYCALKTQAA